MSGLILPRMNIGEALLAKQKEMFEDHSRGLAGQWTRLPLDDCEETPQPCMDCYRSLVRGDREAFTPALIALYGNYNEQMKAMKFRCRGGCKPRNTEK